MCVFNNDFHYIFFYDIILLCFSKTIEREIIMRFNFKEYETQDLLYKGPMRRRYEVYEEKYKGYLIYRYIRGEYTRYCCQDEKDVVYVETDNIEEVREFIDNELS